LLQACEKAVRKWQKEHQEVTARMGRLEDVLESARRLEALHLAPEKLRQLEYLAVRLGWIPSDQCERLSLPSFHPPSSSCP
jgi:vacuolar-type H+-ATPase subunit I/STV1